MILCLKSIRPITRRPWNLPRRPLPTRMRISSKNNKISIEKPICSKEELIPSKNFKMLRMLSPRHRLNWPPPGRTCNSPTPRAFPVLVLAPAQYVGAMGPRAIARVVGTIIGGFAGVWLVGNYEQDRLFFLLFAFVYIFFCMYSFGGSIFPYAFSLCAKRSSAHILPWRWPSSSLRSLVACSGLPS